MGIAHYLRKAFTSPWNLLIFFGSGVAAVLSPWPDVLLPLIGAGEALYLGALVSLPRYREAIDAQEANQTRGHAAAVNVNQLVIGLGTDAQQRFNALKRRCLEMRSIASATRPTSVDGTTDAWTPALDRLLYGFLRLLGQQNSLLRFLRSTAIAEQRLDNYGKAVKNADFAAAELDRVEAKIQALIEMAANRQDPDLLSSQVDAAAASMDHTEATLNQLQQITPLADDMEQAPAILDDAGKPPVRDRG